MASNNPYNTKTINIYRDGKYYGNIVVDRNALLFMSEEERDDLIFSTFPELKNKSTNNKNLKD